MSFTIWSLAIIFRAILNAVTALLGRNHMRKNVSLPPSLESEVSLLPTRDRRLHLPPEQVRTPEGCHIRYLTLSHDP